MNREGYIQYCSDCKHKKIDTKKGLVCSLTMDHPAFEKNCESKEFQTTISYKKRKEGERYIKHHLNNAHGIMLIILVVFLYYITVALSFNWNNPFENSTSNFFFMIFYAGVFLVSSALFRSNPVKYTVAPLAIFMCLEIANIFILFAPIMKFLPIRLVILTLLIALKWYLSKHERTWAEVDKSKEMSIDDYLSD